MALSQQLRQIASNISQQAQRQGAAAQGANVFQTQQAMTQAVQQQPPGAGVDAAKMAQQFAPAITQAQSQAALQTQQQAGQQQLAATQALAQEGAQKKELDLREKQLEDDVKIAERQREGKLRQNSAELRQAKELTQDEIQTQQRIRALGFAYDNRLSFLTRKQREDLAAFGGYLRQQIFDSRLQFDISEGERKFSNNRQLADFAVMQAESDIDLQNKKRIMQQAYEKDRIMLETARQKILDRLEFEFKKSEQEINQQLTQELYEKKRAVEAEIRRKKQQGAMVRSIGAGVIRVGGIILAPKTGGASVVAAEAAAQGIEGSGDE